jgi:hypothetical protein
MNRQDDPALTGELLLYRRIPPKGDRVTWENGVPIPSTQNFRDKENELSLYIANETTPQAVLQGHDGFGLIQLRAQDFRDVYAEYGKLLVICRDDEEPENGHVLICGKPTPSMKEKLRNLAQWVPGKWPASELEV